MAGLASDATRARVPLAALFAKAEAASVQVSPLGNYVAWLARADSVLNLWLASLPLSEGGVHAQARQLTNAKGRDICFCYRFTKDEKRIVYLRESEHGQELYHLHAVDIRESEASTAQREPRDMLAAHRGLTCAVGFAGGLQLWLPPTTPHVAILATGRGSLLWDLSALDLETGELTRLETNQTSTNSGIVRLVVGLLLHVAVHVTARLVAFLSLGLATLQVAWLHSIAPAPGAAVQYFVDGRSGRVLGRAEATLSLDGVALRISKRRARDGGWVAVCDDVPFSKLSARGQCARTVPTPAARSDHAARMAAPLLGPLLGTSRLSLRILLRVRLRARQTCSSLALARPPARCDWTR